MHVPSGTVEIIVNNLGIQLPILTEARSPNRKKGYTLGFSYTTYSILTVICTSDTLFPIHFVDFQVSEEITYLVGERCLAAERLSPQQILPKSCQNK